MNPAPDYAAAYLSIMVDDGTSGHAFAFTIGRGNDLQVQAIQAFAPFLVGRDIEHVVADLGGVSRALIGDSQLRWLGPEKGVIHMAAGAVINALFDLAAKRAGLPLWKYLANLDPEDLLDLVDFRYLSDVLTRSEALELLSRHESGKIDRIRELEQHGYPAYTTSPGWLGYTDDKLERLCQEAVKEGFTQIKIKVGVSLADDMRRCQIARQAIGPDIGLAVDANQVWDVEPAIEWIQELARFDLAWVEEPTHPDDILGLARIRAAVSPGRVATGEHVANRVMFKQLLQADAVDVIQIDASRVAGVTDNLAVLLMAAKFGIPVCPHAGGVGLCELVQHLSFFDYASISASMDNRRIEWIDHLHQHFRTPAAVSQGRYLAPTAPGNSAELLPSTVADYEYPDGPVWKSLDG